jgi:hypothetical protein
VHGRQIKTRKDGGREDPLSSKKRRGGLILGPLSRPSQSPAGVSSKLFTLPHSYLCDTSTRGLRTPIRTAPDTTNFFTLESCDQQPPPGGRRIFELLSTATFHSSYPIDQLVLILQTRGGLCIETGDNLVKRTGGPLLAHLLVKPVPRFTHPTRTGVR